MVKFIRSSLWQPTHLNWENPDDLAEKLSSHQFCSNRHQPRQGNENIVWVGSWSLHVYGGGGLRSKKSREHSADFFKLFPKDRGVVGSWVFSPGDFPGLLVELC